MKEDQLQVIWGDLHFDHSHLQTTKGAAVQILDPGIQNHDQGPDFLSGTLRIDGVLYHGNVEIHLKSQDWFRHNHEKDENYNSVVLHVVLKSDGTTIFCEDGTRIPEIEIGERINPKIIQLSTQAIRGSKQLPCSPFLATLPPQIISGWLQELGQKRIREKARVFHDRLSKTNGDWGQVLWEGLSRSLGGKVNGDIFEEIAQRIPARIIRLYASDPIRIEALLFGMFGFLHSPRPLPVYYSVLFEHWQFLSAKHKLSAPLRLLRNHRMHPAGQPTIRISQLASLLCQYPQPGELLANSRQIKFLQTKVSASVYWTCHSNFDKAHPKKEKNLGMIAKKNILLNTLIPMAWLFQGFHGNEESAEVAFLMLSKMKAENNKVTRRYSGIGISANSAIETQGILHLEKEYCAPRNCLTCALGRKILEKKY